MANYDKNKFYWLQLREDFFDEDAINWLEEQPNGKEYCLFYIKLCLKSLKNNAILVRKIGQMLVPYDCEKLAELTKTPVDTVVIAMKLLTQIGLIKILKNGEIFLTKVVNMIGAKSIGAFKKEQQRLLKGGQLSTDCPPFVHFLSTFCPPETRNKNKTNINISLDNSLSINNIINQSMRACACEEEAMQTLREIYNDYFSYWGYEDNDKNTFDEIIQTIAKTYFKAKTEEFSFYNQKYNDETFITLISVLDIQDLRDIVWQVMNNDNIQSRDLYILGALISRATEKIEKLEKEQKESEEDK